MATQTTKLGLTKPAKTEYYNIDTYNANLDKIDTAITKSQPNGGTINLGIYNTGAILTSSGTELYFSIPTGRIISSISSISFDLCARVANPNGTGIYLVRGTSGGTDWAHFTITPASGSGNFYNGDNAAKTVTSAACSVEGETNIGIRITSQYGGTNVNNNPCVLNIKNIIVTL